MWQDEHERRDEARPLLGVVSGGASVASADASAGASATPYLTFDSENGTTATTAATTTTSTTTAAPRRRLSALRRTSVVQPIELPPPPNPRVPSGHYGHIVDAAASVRTLHWDRSLHQDLYYWSLRVPWRRFIASALAALAALAAVATIACTLHWSSFSPAIESHAQLFVFHVMFLCGFGMGKFTVTGSYLLVLVCIESLARLLFFSVLTGLLYARLAKPVSRIRFASHLLFTPQRAVPLLVGKAKMDTCSSVSMVVPSRSNSVSGGNGSDVSLLRPDAVTDDARAPSIFARSGSNAAAIASTASITSTTASTESSPTPLLSRSPSLQGNTSPSMSPAATTTATTTTATTTTPPPPPTDPHHHYCLQFRIANDRTESLANSHVQVTLSTVETDDRGNTWRAFRELALVRSTVPLFSLPWTCVHLIDESSPLFGMSKSDLQRAHAHVLVVVTATDTVFGGGIVARNVYLPEHMYFDCMFTDMLSSRASHRTIDMALLDAVEAVPASTLPRSQSSSTLLSSGGGGGAAATAALAAAAAATVPKAVHFRDVKNKSKSKSVAATKTAIEEAEREEERQEEKKRDHSSSSSSDDDDRRVLDIGDEDCES